MTEEDVRYLVDNNISLYQELLPNTWKVLLLRDLEKYAEFFSGEVSDEFLFLFIEAMTDEIPWFGEVITKDKKSWLLNEFVLIDRDLNARKKI